MRWCVIFSMSVVRGRREWNSSVCAVWLTGIIRIRWVFFFFLMHFNIDSLSIYFNWLYCTWQREQCFSLYLSFRVSVTWMRFVSCSVDCVERWAIRMMWSEIVWEGDRSYLGTHRDCEWLSDKSTRINMNLSTTQMYRVQWIQ